MTDATDAEHAYDRARFGILSARAALMQYAAPLPGLEVTIPDERWEIVRRADAVASEAERKMEEALEIIRTGLLGWPPAGPGTSSSATGEDQESVTDYGEQAAAFIAGVERYAALGLPELPDDPAAASAMRATGYEVLAEVKELDDPVLAGFAIVHVLSEDEGLEHVVRAQDVATALGVPAGDLAGRQFIATLRETPETGPVLSGFRPVPEPAAGPAAAGTEMTVRCLLVFGDQAELVPDGAGEEGDVARWPAAAIAEQTGLQLKDLPGKRFRARVTEQDGRVLFSAFSLLP